MMLVFETQTQQVKIRDICISIDINELETAKDF